jgi:murein DD-endopeptidase MepM/ murein hydrolase activator NlpD
LSKRYTVLVVPEGTRHVKRYKIPIFIIPVLAVIWIAGLVMGGYWLNRYQNLRGDLPALTALQEQSLRQEAQMELFAERLAGFKQQMAKLKGFNHRLRVLANLEKPKENSEPFGVGGPEEAGGGPGIRLSSSARERLLQAMQRDLDRLSVDGETEQAVQRQLAEFLKERRSILACTPSIWPVKGWVTSGFGYRNSPFTGKRQFHAGIDISTRTGTPIHAPADGVVSFSGRESGYGRMVVVNHGHGMMTRYGHLHKIKVKVGDKLERGTLIGTVGSSGRTTGPHLHYEVLLSGVPTNPRNYFLD